MIKRLKWNVLYGGGNGAESDGGLSSSSEEDDDDVDFVARQAEANKVLQELVERDPDFAETLHQKLNALGSSSSEDEDEAHNGEKEQGSSSSDEDNDGEIKAKGKAESVKGMVEEEVGDDGGDASADSSDDEGLAEDADLDAIKEEEEEDPDQKYAEWRECDLCPGKRFLSDTEVEAHLSSKKHLRAVAKFEKLQREATERESKRDPDAPIAKEGPSGVEHPVPRDAKPDTEDTAIVALGNIVTGKAEAEDEERKKAKRKAGAKRKLKALKQKKWEKKMKARELRTEGNAAQNAEAEDDPSNAEKQQSHAEATSKSPPGDYEPSGSKRKKKGRTDIPNPKKKRNDERSEEQENVNRALTGKVGVATSSTAKSSTAVAKKEERMPESKAVAPEANGDRK